MNKDLINSEHYLEWLEGIEFENKDEKTLINHIKKDLYNVKKMNQHEYTLWQNGKS